VGPWRKRRDTARSRISAVSTDALARLRAYYAAAGDSARRAERVIAVSPADRVGTRAPCWASIRPACRVVHEAALPSSRRGTAKMCSVADRLGLNLQSRAHTSCFVPPCNQGERSTPAGGIRLLRPPDRCQLLLVARAAGSTSRFRSAREGWGRRCARFLGPLGETIWPSVTVTRGCSCCPAVRGLRPAGARSHGVRAPVVCSNAGPLPEVADDAPCCCDRRIPARGPARCRACYPIHSWLARCGRRLRRRRPFHGSTRPGDTRVYREALLAMSRLLFLLPSLPIPLDAGAAGFAVTGC